MAQRRALAPPGARVFSVGAVNLEVTGDAATRIGIGGTAERTDQLLRRAASSAFAFANCASASSFFPSWRCTTPSALYTAGLGFSASERS